MKFEYVEIDPKGKKTKNVISANTQQEAVTILQKQGKMISSIHPAKENIFLRQIVFNKNRLIAKFTESLANMMSAGITLIDALEIIYEEENEAVMKKIIKDLMMNLKKGASFHQCLLNHPIFPSLYISMIQAGEETGKLKEVLYQLQDYTKKKMEMREKIVSALYYPSFLIGLSIMTVLYLLIKVMPEFFQIFEGFDAELPGITLFLMNTMHFFQKFTIPLLIGIVILIIILYRYMKTEKGYKQIEQIMLKIPRINQVYQMMININFFKPFSLLLTNKVNLLKTLDIIKESVRSQLLKETINNIASSLKKGKGVLGKDIKNPVFTKSTLQMLHIGERSGKLKEIVSHLEQNLSNKMEEDIKRMVVMIEPVLILIIGLIIGFIVISALLPIYSLSTMVK